MKIEIFKGASGILVSAYCDGRERGDGRDPIKSVVVQYGADLEKRIRDVIPGLISMAQEQEKLLDGSDAIIDKLKGEIEGTIF